MTGLRSVAWHRSIQPMVLALAVLAGVGHGCARARLTPGEPSVVGRRGPSGRPLSLVALLWLVGRGRLPAFESGIRARSFVWPVIEIVVGLVVVGGPLDRPPTAIVASWRPHDGPAHLGRWAGIVLLACETAFLVSAGAPFVSSSPTFLVPTPAETALRQAVGSALVAFGTRDCHTPPTLGIYQDVNVVYGVRELADWDPMTPEAIFRSLRASTGQPAGAVGAPLILCPAIDNATVARRYGVGFILEHAGSPRPRGTVFVTTVRNEKLYRVPHAAAATLTPARSRRCAPPGGRARHGRARRATPMRRRGSSPPTRPVPSVLRLHLADVPGWHATIDGHPLALESFSGSMMQARVPAGRHTVVLRYWPSDVHGRDRPRRRRPRRPPGRDHRGDPVCDAGARHPRRRGSDSASQ